MFAKFVGRRVTAVATALAVVVGLAITPAFTATAAEGDEPVIVEAPLVEPAETPAPLVEPVETPTPLVELVETPAAETPVPLVEPVETPAEETPASETPAPLVEPVETPAPLAETPAPLAETPAPLVELVETPSEETPAPQRMMRSSVPEQSSSMGIQSTGITPETLPSEFLLGEDLDVQFGGVDADRWDMNFDFLSNANLSDSGHLTGYFSRPGWHTLTVKAQDWKWLWWDTVATKSYTFKVVPAVLTSSLSNATVGDSYSEQLDGTLAQGVYQPSKFSKVSGTLPPGLNLSDTGVISGIVQSVPANPKTYTFEVRLTVGNWLTGRFHSAPKTLSITVGYPAPTWSTITLPDATVGVTYPDTSISANGNGWSVGTYTATGLPNGLTLSSDGVLSGTPLLNNSYGPIETVEVTFTADNGRTASTTADLVVKTPPKFVTTSPLPNAVVGTPYSTFIKTLGPDVRYTLRASSPVGMAIDPVTGEITGWTPADETNVRIRVKIQNAAGSDDLGFTIKPFAVPAITTTTLTNGIVGQSYSDQIVFTGRSAIIEKTAGTLPNGVKLMQGKASNGGGAVTGTPTNGGVFNFTVTVTNDVGTATHDYEIRVHDVPVIHVTNLDRAVVGQAYSDRVQFSGVDAEAAVLRGAPPTGLTLNADGTFSGSPSEVGVFKFTVKVSNQAGSVTHRYRIVSFDVPAFTTTSLDHGIVGMAYSQQLTADGHNVRFVVPRTSSLPAGLTLDRNGLLHGTPNAAGEFTFDIRARNFAGNVVQSFTLTVTQPAMTLSSNRIIRGNSLTVSGNGYLPGDTLELWLHSTPVLLGTVTATDGTFSSTVKIPAGTAAGQHHLVVNAAQSGTQSVPLTVASPPATPQRPQSTPQSQSPQLTVTPADDTQATEVVEDAEPEETEGDTEEADEEELPTLNQPEAEEEAAGEIPANLSGLLYAGFAVLLAALILWFILWRRRRATQE